MKPANSFVAITTEGGMLPADFLAELLAPKNSIDGLTPVSYNLADGERINEQVNRSWNRLIGRWADFKKAISAKEAGESTTTDTRDRWLYPIFQELGFGQRLSLAQPIEVDGRPYAVSHGWGHVPIHLVGSHADLDRRTPGAVGAAKASPHSLVQQLLNASDSHLWGIVSNGLTFRLLRDNVALTRLSYIEWDLAAIFDGDLYAEFFLLWLVAHQSRFDAERPELCWLERWKKSAEDKGLRALENLYPGVKTAISAVGAGLVAHQANVALLQKLRTGELSTQDFYRQVLRIIYRLLFLLVAEDRGLLHPPGDAEEVQKARRRYRDFYSIARLRALTIHRAGTPHPDLWHVLQFVTGKLGSDIGCPELALPALGSFLWTAEQSTPDLLGCVLSNRHFLEAVHALAFVQDDNVRRAVDYKNLGSEELGSVYQGLLEMHPQINADAGTFILDTSAGNERKTSGSYYTPDSLVQCLLDSALEPVIAEKLARAKTAGEKEAALLGLKVCDPAVGSGHFILRAGHRIAKHLARVRSGEEEPSPATYRTALRDVIGRCLYGVDINPMSAELCRVSLWLEAIEPGKPLSFLDHHIRVGNSLFGATPELIAEGIPDDAFMPIEGDDKAYSVKFKKQNKEEKNQLHLDEWVPLEHIGNLPEAMVRLDTLRDDTPEQVLEKQRRYEELALSQDYVYGRFLADTWCAAFVWRKAETDGLLYPITNRVLRQIERNPKSIYEFTPWLRDEVQRLARQYQFFHWHLAFPEVFSVQSSIECGFDCVIGNPPWEMMEAGDGEVSSNEFARLQLCYKSNQYKVLNGRRDLYKLFLANSLALPRRSGRLGFLTPLGVFIEDDASEWRRMFFNRGSVIQLRHFQNYRKRFFHNIHASYRFCAVTYSPDPTKEHTFSTVANLPEELAFQYFVRVSREEFDDWLGVDRSATIFSSREYAQLHRSILASLRRKDSTRFKVVAEFHSSSDKALILEYRPELGWALPKNRNIHYFNHNFAPYEAWIEHSDVKARLGRKGLIDEGWYSRFPRLLFRDIARNDDERTLIACLAPPGLVSSYDTPMFLPECNMNAYSRWVAFYGALFSSFLFDFLIRPFVDKHIKGYTLARLTWPTPKAFVSNHLDYGEIVARMLELVFIAPEFQPFAQDCGWFGPEFQADEERRFLMRCELDALLLFAFLPVEKESSARTASNETSHEMASQIMSLPSARDAVVYILKTFPLVEKKDVVTHNSFRTRDVILSVYDAIQLAVETGEPYQSLVNPPPGPPTDAQGRFLSMYQLDRERWPIHLYPPSPRWHEQILAAWFAIRQKKWSQLADEQVFPWDGRESFIYALIPYLTKEKPGEKFEYYRYAALLAADAKNCETLLLEDSLRTTYRELMSPLDWLNFPAEHRVRTKSIREHLQSKSIIKTDPASGVTTLHDEIQLPPLPPELRPLIPLILTATNNLVRLQAGALERSEAEKVGMDYNQLTAVVDSLLVA